MKAFGKELINRTFIAPSGRKFTVRSIEPYPKNKVSPRYRAILSLPVGVLVAVSYRGTLIPNITLQGGVARLMAIETNEQIYNRPGAISNILGVKKTFMAYPIT